MKKFLSLILALAMVACMSVTAFAAEGPGGSTKLTTTVPEKPLYTLHIPANQSIDYKAEKTNIGMVYVTDVDTTVKNVHTVCSYDKKLTSGTNTIPYDLMFDSYTSWTSTYALGEKLGFNMDPITQEGYIFGDVDSVWYGTDEFYILISEEAWNAAVPGDYSTTITWTTTYTLK